MERQENVMSKFRLLVPVFLVPIFMFLVPSLAFAELPDGRVYEMVTPVENHGAGDHHASDPATVVRLRSLGAAWPGSGRLALDPSLTWPSY